MSILLPHELYYQSVTRKYNHTDLFLSLTIFQMKT